MKEKNAFYCRFLCTEWIMFHVPKYFQCWRLKTVRIFRVHISICWRYIIIIYHKWYPSSPAVVWHLRLQQTCKGKQSQEKRSNEIPFSAPNLVKSGKFWWRQQGQNTFSPTSNPRPWIPWYDVWYYELHCCAVGRVDTLLILFSGTFIKLVKPCPTITKFRHHVWSRARC